MNGDSTILGQLAEEFTRKVREGDQPDIEEYARRFPELAPRIRELVPTLMLLEAAGAQGTTGELRQEYSDEKRTLSEIAGAPAFENLGPRGKMPEEGKRFGPYQIIRLLGKGGFGQVWESENVETGRRLALKVLSNVDTVTPDVLARFQREGRLAASLSHPNCVYVFGAEQVEGYPVKLMELISGGTLQDKLRIRIRLPVAEAVDYILEVIEGLEAAQKAGILHRDVKRSNCFLDDRGHAKIGDFGLSRTLEKQRSTLRTASGSFMGTPSYASPEQVRGRQLDSRSDIYSVGATLYALLTGKPPFEASHTGELLARIVAEDPTDFSQHKVKVPRRLQRIIFRTLAKDPSKRFPDYARLRAELLPFSSSGFTRSGMARRFAAFLIDATILDFVFTRFALDEASTRWPLQSKVLHYLLTHILVNFLYFLIMEKRWGHSLGKWLFGLKVANIRGDELTWLQALTRTSMFCLFYCISYIWAIAFGWIFWNIGIRLPLLSNLSGLLVFVMIAPIISAHRKNGYAGLHELASRTRVWIRQRQSETFAVPHIESAGTPLADGMPQHFGPYKALALLWETEPDALILSRDEVLKRDVWVRHFRDVSKACTIGGLIAARSGRLRWLQGVRKPDESWDAYEVPSGTSFCDWVKTSGRLSWREMRAILLGISKTLAAESATGNANDEISLEQIWITDYGQIKILDFPFRGKRSLEPMPQDSLHLRMFLHQAALFGLEGRFVRSAALHSLVPAVPLPQYAWPVVRSLCGQGEAPNTAGTLAQSLENLATLPALLTRRRRLAPQFLVAGVFGVWLALSLLLSPLARLYIFSTATLPDLALNIPDVPTLSTTPLSDSRLRRRQYIKVATRRG